jgi:DNA-binding IclR family transcriptional regulator
MKRSKSDYVIQTVTNALRVLEAYRDKEELGVTELSRRLGLHKNNVFRLLATLENKGYVEQSADSDRYRLGVRCLELGHAYGRSGGLLRQARAILEALSRVTCETVHLGALQDFEVAHLDGEQPDQLVLTGLRVGRRLPVHCTALGKVLLGCGDGILRERFDRLCVVNGTLEARTTATITDRDKFFEHLRAVASQGYALDLEESEVGLCCAAAPVYAASGRVIAALSVSGPTLRLNRDALLDRVVPALLPAAEGLSKQLGYQGYQET